MFRALSPIKINKTGMKKEAMPNHLLIKRFPKYAPVLPAQFSTEILGSDNIPESSKL